ncbi:MAG: hypothetical protein CR975_03085 [Gammaproteobacteria bacterium]|nr:MAG: hypothetical protein CR975_03085 [Gammaproteobacteria bacterium]
MPYPFCRRPQGVLPQGVLPQGVLPQGVLPQGGCCLRGCCLRGCCLRGCCLRGCCLRGCCNLLNGCDRNVGRSHIGRAFLPNRCCLGFWQIIALVSGVSGELLTFKFFIGGFNCFFIFEFLDNNGWFFLFNPDKFW